MVGREPGIGQRRRLDRVKAAERDQQPGCRDEHERGESAVAPEPAAERPDLGCVLAEVLLRQPTGTAAAAAPRPVHGDRVTDLEALYAGAERLHPAGVLVPERERQRKVKRTRRPFHQVQVGMAGTSPRHLDQHLPGSRLGHLDLAELWRLLPPRHLVGPHPCPLLVMVFPGGLSLTPRPRWQ